METLSHSTPTPEKQPLTYDASEAIDDLGDDLDPSLLRSVTRARRLHDGAERAAFNRHYDALSNMAFRGKDLSDPAEQVRIQGLLGKDRAANVNIVREEARRLAENDAMLALADETDDELLAMGTYEPDSDEYSKMRDAILLLATIDADDWDGDDDNPGVYDQLSARVRKNRAKSSSPQASTTQPAQNTQSTTVNNPDRSTPEGLADVEGRVNLTRGKFAEYISKRTTKIFEGKHTAAEIDAAYEEYTDMVSAIATEKMLKAEEEGVSEDILQKQIEDYINEQVDKTIANVEAERASAYLQRSPLMKKFLNKWISWGGKGEKLFSKERFKGNLKKGALFAIPTAVVAGALAPVAGAVGAGLGVGVGVAAGAGALGRAMARKFASNKLDDIANAQTIANKQAEEMHRRINEQRDGAEDENLHSLLDVVHERSQAYRKRNQRRLMGSMAIAAASAFVGSTAGNLIHDAVVDGHVGDWISNKFHHDNNGATGSDKGSNIGGGHEPKEPRTGSIDKPVVQPKALTYDQVFDGSRGTTHLTSAGKADFAKWMHGREVKSGDSVWKLAEQYQKSRHLNTSVYSTDALKDYGVKYLQGKGFADSRGWLNKGDIIK